MKLINAILLLMVLPVIAICQIPNASFENWTNSAPDDWQINSSPPSLLPVTQSTDAHSGNYALRCEIVDDSGIPFGPFVQPSSTSHGFSYTQNDSVLYGFYKADMINSNLGLVEVWIYDSLLNQIGAGFAMLPSIANYTEFAIPIIYTPGSVPYEMSIIIQMTDTDTTGGFNVGSYFLIDDLSFTHTSTVNIGKPIQSYYSVSPNPANDVIAVHADFLNREKIYYTIYDIMGKKILSDQIHAVSANSTDNIDVSSLNPGNYLMIITDGKNSSTKKIVISR